MALMNMMRTSRRKLLRLMVVLAAPPGAATAQAIAPALPAALALARPAGAVQPALLAAVAQLPPAHPRRRRYRLAVPFDTPLFPPDHLLREAPGQPYDAGLDAWLALPRSQRRQDVLLLPDEDYYWRDPGAGDGDGDGDGEYRAQFIVHVAPAGATATLLSIVQVHARRRHGKAFDLLGRTGPGWYWDIRPAPPSPASAATLAADLALWLGARRQDGAG
jgi:hypothetical protein